MSRSQHNFIDKRPPLMDMDFAVRCLLVQRSRLISGFCSSTHVFAPRFFRTPLTEVAVSLILHLHQVGWKTFTSELLNMLGTHLSCLAALLLSL